MGQTLRRGGAGGRAWRLSSYRQQVLSPTPLLPERKVTVTCLSVKVGGAIDGVCDDEQLATALVLAGASARCCSPLGITVAILVRSEVRRVTLVLGDGSRRAVPLRDVPGDPDGLAAGITFVGPSLAIRRMVVTGANGDVLSSMDLELRAVPRHRTAMGSSRMSYVYEQQRAANRRAPCLPSASTADVQLCLAPDRAPNARR